MDFDDELIVSLHAPEEQPSPPTPTSTTPTNQPQTRPPQPKDSETYYIRPIPSGLRAPNIKALLALCHDHTLHHGFDVVKKAGVKPSTTKSGRKTIIPGAPYYKWHITCVLAGKTKNTRHLTEEMRRREKGSLKMGCPSRVWAWAVDRENPDGEWEIRWGDTDPAIHNHPPVDVATLPNHRRRARERVGFAEAVRDIAQQGLGRKEALQKLRELIPGGLFTEKDIANELQKYKQILKDEAAAQQLEDGGEMENDEVGDVSGQQLVGQMQQQQVQASQMQQQELLRQQQQQMQGQQLQGQHQHQHHVFQPGVDGGVAYW